MQHILGQSRAIDVLTAAVRSGRLHHAYIFHGMAGVGKFTTAVAYAKLLLCPNAQPHLMGNLSCCDSCESCRLVDAGSHPDLHIIVKELALTSEVTKLRSAKLRNIPVDVLREHVIGGKTGDDRFHEGKAYKKSMMMHHKVFIIDEAELLDETGQNALLKTLEEPPNGTFFILVTSNEDRLLPTVRSRSQRVAFVPLGDDIVSQWIAEHGASLDAATQQWLTRFADGSIGRAKLAMDYDLNQWAQRIVPELTAMTQGRWDVTLGGSVAEFVKDFAETWVKRHDNASKDAANKLAVQLMWLLIAREARSHLAQIAEHTDPANPFTAEEQMRPWLDVIDILEDCRMQIDRNVNLSMVCESLISRIGRTLIPAGAR